MPFERLIEFHEAFDKRDADPKKNYGVHGVDIRFVLKGERGAVQFLVYTNWHLPESASKYIQHNQPIPVDVGIHSRTPLYDEHEVTMDSCEYLDGDPCYFDGSGRAADVCFNILLREGSEGVWRYLEERYHLEYPEPEDAKA